MASASQLKRIERLEAFSHNVANLVYLDDKAHTLQIGEQRYVPSRTGVAFHRDRSLVKCIMGPYGSGKTVTACNDLAMKAMQMPKCHDGVRKSRFAVIRNTYAELETTTIKSWMEWMSELGVSHLYAKSPFRFNATFYDADGEIQLEVIFLALDKPKDIKKLKSLELTGALIEEACEVPESIMRHLLGRINRYPRRMDVVADYYSFVELVTNPPSEDHWIYGVFEVQKPDGFTIYHQPPALTKNEETCEWELNTSADNIKNLPERYYFDMIQGASEDFIKVYALGQYGMVSNNTPVYPEYVDDLHSSDKIEYVDTLPINFWWDFGLTPCVGLLQVMEDGCINAIDEITSTHSGLEQFVENQVIPHLNQHYSGYQKGWSVGDPSGKAGDQIRNKPILTVIRDGRFVTGALDELGFETEAANTNAILARIGAVKKALTKLIGSRPQLKISRKCKVLRKGFIGSYCLVNDNKDDMSKYSPTPSKNFFSHIHDALQYGVLKCNENNLQVDEKDFSELSSTTY